MFDFTKTFCNSVKKYDFLYGPKCIKPLHKYNAVFIQFLLKLYVFLQLYTLYGLLDVTGFGLVRDSHVGIYTLIC